MSVTAFVFAKESGYAVVVEKGVKNIDSLLSTSIRTTVILIISFLIVILFNSFEKINSKTIIYLILSGISTSLLWINYFKALDFGNVNEVTPVDKTSIVITLILSSIFLNELKYSS